MNIGRISDLISNETCFEMIRENRWPDGAVRCPHYSSESIKKSGHDNVQVECQHYCCKFFKRYFDELTKIVFSGHHRPLKVWIACLYLMGLNVSNSQVAQELDLCASDAHHMTTVLRNGVVDQKPEVILDGEVEFDEVYIIAGYKVHPEA